MQFLVSIVSGYTIAGTLMDSSSNWSAQKVVEAVIQNLMVLLAAELGWFSLQWNFQEQKPEGRLQEEVKAVNHLIIFYPKFYCVKLH